MNNDVAIEILFYLPVRSLLRFRAVSKFWCDVIDSPCFRKQHTELHNNNDDHNNEKADAVYLQFTFPRHARKRKLSTKLLDNGKYLNSHYLPAKYLSIVGAVKGLICISSFCDNQSICICNPFIGQFKILPLSPHSSRPLCGGTVRHQQVGFGFDEDYKVVQLVSCFMHKYCYANLYSRRTNSWKELEIDQGLVVLSPIKSLCNNGSFVHWEGWTIKEEKTIISFDMKNEVFRTITISDNVLCVGMYEWYEEKIMSEIFAKDECSFLLFVSSRDWVKVYESRGEGSELEWNWNYVMSLEPLLYGELPLWSSNDYVVSKNCVLMKNNFTKKEGVWYDYRAQKFIGRLLLGRVELYDDSYVIEYEGSFISP